jgi:hypothetical protein
MKRFRLHLLWIGFLLFILSLIVAQYVDSLLISFPKPFGFRYSSVMLTTGVFMCVSSMIWSWWVDSMMGSNGNEVGTVILTTITTVVFQFVVVFIINILIEALIEAIFDPG